MKSMLNLLETYEFEFVGDYYEMIEDSFVNGQISQAKQQFLSMPGENQREFLRELHEKQSQYLPILMDLIIGD